jgi:hypothetical protein
MLHDLYLLTCYFEPVNAVLYEEELAVRAAAQAGYLEFFRAPCGRGAGKYFCRLSPRGLGQIENAPA